MKKVYKVLVCKRNSRNYKIAKCFWKYFYSLSDLVAYMQKSCNARLCFPTLRTILTKEEFNILNKKLGSPKTVDLMPEGLFKDYYTHIVLGWDY